MTKKKRQIRFDRNQTSSKQLEKIWEKIWGARDLEKAVSDLKKNQGKGSDLYLQVHFPFVEKEIKKISSKARVLEAGCGFGQWVFFIGEKGCEVVGIDIAKKAIEVAQNYAVRKKIKNCRFYHADIRAIPFKDGYFDRIFSFGVIEHYKDPSDLLSEFYRVLETKGRLFISVPNVCSLHTITRPITQALGLWRFGYERSYSLESLKKLLTSSGFKICEDGVMPGEEFFGNWPNYIPLIGQSLYNFLRKISLFLESNQDIFSFWIYIVAEK